MEDVISLADLEGLARERLPRMAWDYYASGAHDELTLGENTAAWQRLRLHYRVLAGVATRDTSTRVLGQEVALPVLVAPMAFQQMAHPEGEVAMTRGAGAAGAIMVLSTLSNVPVEEVVAAATGPVWFQLYIYRDRGATAALVARAEAAGCSALVVTVDAPVLGTRERDVRNRFHLPEGLRAANLTAAGYDALDEVEAASGLAAYVASLLDPALSWSDVAWLRSITSLPVIVKGVVRPDDAVRAAEHGAAGIMVSNHGGRQLDTAPATAEVLGPITDAVGDRVEVLVDGGIRRGTSVVKALALGARAVLLGRPCLWGLAAGGAPGVTRALSLLGAELDQAMALCGCATVADISADLVRPGP